jgi:hypothetical protein
MIFIDKNKKEIELVNCKECQCLIEKINEVQYDSPFGSYKEYYCDSHKKRYIEVCVFDKITYKGLVEMDKDGNQIKEKIITKQK